eukprot:4649528-Alexandrium_andersonii.AAC.1
MRGWGKSVHMYVHCPLGRWSQPGRLVACPPAVVAAGLGGPMCPWPPRAPWRAAAAAAACGLWCRPPFGHRA